MSGEEKQHLEGDEFEVLYKKLRTASRRLYVVEEEIDELYARVERLEKQKKDGGEQSDEIEEIKEQLAGVLERVDDLDRRLTDCEEDIRTIFAKLDDLKSYTDKAFAIAKKVERHLGLEGDDEKSKRSSRRR